MIVVGQETTGVRKIMVIYYQKGHQKRQDYLHKE